MLLMASSAKILLTLNSRRLTLQGCWVLIICEVEDFQIDKPLLLLGLGLQLPQQ